MAKIMIVDDSVIVRNTLIKQLKEMGHHVVYAARDGKEAVDYYREDEKNIELITMDITMPIVDGLEALKQILEINALAQVIMITSHGEEELVMNSIEAGAIGYMLKPITSEKLKKQLESL